MTEEPNRQAKIKPDPRKPTKSDVKPRKENQERKTGKATQRRIQVPKVTNRVATGEDSGTQTRS
jgi:hypothetical protein